MTKIESPFDDDHYHNDADSSTEDETATHTDADGYDAEGPIPRDQSADGYDIAEYLDRMDDDRMEWARLTEDVYPLGASGESDGPTPSHVHRDTDEMQRYLAEQRQSEA